MLGMKFITLTALTSAAFIAVGAGIAVAQSNVVIMQDPGGGYGDALRKVMYDPFEKETGIKVVTVHEARSGPRIKAQAEAGKAQWDLTFIFDQETKLLGDCCLADIDYSKLSESAASDACRAARQSEAQEGRRFAGDRRRPRLQQRKIPG